MILIYLPRSWKKQNKNWVLFIDARMFRFVNYKTRIVRCNWRISKGKECGRWANMALGEGAEHEHERERGYREYRGNEEFPSNMMHTMVALGIWLGSIHFNVLLILVSFTFFPLSISLLVLGLLLLFMFIPIDEHSKLGRSLSRYLFCSASAF